jgi:hypothetical protein
MPIIDNGTQQELPAALAAVPLVLACSASGGLKCVDARALSSLIGGRNAATCGTSMVLGMRRRNKPAFIVRRTIDVR